MTSKPASVAGDWTGVYDYGEGFDDAVPFTAMLFDVAGAVWGQTRERNGLDPEISGETLRADISGRRSGREVIFTKTYQGSPVGGEFPITYAGLLSGDGRRIEGRWTIPAMGPDMTGPFRMDRIPGAASRRAARTEATESVGI